MISIIASTAKGFMDLSDREVFSWVGLGWVGYRLWNVHCRISVIHCKMLAQKNAKFFDWILKLDNGFG